MNKNQFDEFMVQQKAFFDKLVDKIGAASKQEKRTPSPPQPPPPNPTENVSKFDLFDPAKESFRSYRQRFELHTKMKKVAENKPFCAQLLLNSIGAENFNTVAALVAPENVADLEYDKLVTVMENHLSPKRNKLVAQHQFLSKFQAENQNISAYTTTLRSEINDCQFECPSCKKSIADVFLRAQLIRGIKDSEIRAKLLEAENDSFDDIFQKAVTLEAAKISSSEISKSSQKPAQPNSNAPAADVFQIKGKKRIKRQNNFNRSKPNNSQQQRYRKSKSKPDVDFKKLGIDGLCLRCGKDNHQIEECRVDRSKLTCNSCRKQGHVAKVCITTLLRGKPESTNVITEELPIRDYAIHQVESDSNPEIDDRFFTHITIENKPVMFEVDSGCKLTLLPKSQFDKLGINVPLKPPDVRLRSYTKEIFTPYGKAVVNIKYKNKSIRDQLYIVPDEYSPIVGRAWIRRLKIRLEEIDQELGLEIKGADVNNIDNPDIDDDIKTRFTDIFQPKIGCTPEFVIDHKLRPGAQPVFHKERGIPYSLLEKVDAELDALEADKIIEKVEISDWGSPLVVVLKPDGSVRLCVDYKTGVNERLVGAHYPIKKSEDIFRKLRNAKYYCKLDLYKAYLHILVSSQSSIIQTITTHRGLYRVNRLAFGIKTAPAEFNRIIDQILQSVPGAISFFDDMIVYGETREECRRNLILCLEQLRKYDLHLNLNKCIFFATRVEYLGHVIEYNKIQKSEKNVTAILKMPKPKSADDIRCFIGMAAHYSRCIPRFSERSAPLRELMKKNAQFKWTRKCQSAFEDLKKEIASDRVLVPYDPKLPVQLACDASSQGLGAILSHTEGDTERPIAYASRALTKAEQNYSQIDREALAIYFGVNHFYQYLFGRKFTLITDNQPLVRIFHSKKELPAMTAGRLQRYAVFLSAFDYEIKHRKGKFHENVDCLSRAPVNQVSIVDEVDQICQNTVEEIAGPGINYKSLQEETRKDKKLSAILNELKTSTKESSYTISENILFKGTRVVVPLSLQSKILEELHQTHLGICKMKQLARRYVYWEGIDNDIERVVKTCKNCQDQQNSPTKAPLHPWQEPKRNWQRIHIDYAGPVDGHQLLIVIDAKSKWLEVASIKEAPTSNITIEILLDLFSRHGNPEIIVSDNASIFTSELFVKFCKQNGIMQKLIAPGHPATNSLGERSVQIVKRKLAEMKDDPTSLQEKLRKILYHYRMTPLAGGKTPSELYLGRQIRGTLDLLKPPEKGKQTSEFNESSKPVRTLRVGERVQSLHYVNNKNEWKYGEVIEVLGKLHYRVKLENGATIKRHINQLRSSPEPGKQPRNQEAPSEETAGASRPSRVRNLPSYLKDYSHPLTRG